jgi:predicted anti-sigma-YlaC factor YlaD
MNPPRRLLGTALAALLALPGCSIKKIAVNSLGNALAEGNSVFATDDDPELVAQAVPFGLKTTEALLQESPRHRGLLLAAVSGFTQYAYGFVQLEADFIEAQDLDRATHLRGRAKKLFLRALDYGFRGLEVDLPGLRGALPVADDPQLLLAKAQRKQVPLLYWTAAAWGAAMSLAKEDANLTVNQDLAAALARRALELDSDWEYGSIHDFFISYEGGRSSVGGSLEKAHEHFERAVAASHGQRAFPYVTYAETVSVGQQHKTEFEQLLEQALAIDVDAVPELRLANLLAQKRARWLLGRVDELFIE